MMKTVLVFSLSLLLNITLRGQEKGLIKGMTITRSVKIKKAIYKLDAPAGPGQSSNIVIEGDNIIIDFNNAELKGSNKKLNPDEFWGIGLIVRNSKNVTLKNLKAKGYKVALMATNVEKLTLENCDFIINRYQYY